MKHANYELKMPTMASQLLKDVLCGVLSYVHMFCRLKTMIVTYILTSCGDSIVPNDWSLCL